MRDVAGLLRSIDYAAWAALDRVASRTPDLPDRITQAALAWRAWASQVFLTAYNDARKPDVPAAVHGGVLDIFVLQKAFYEISYEAANRPGWMSIPVKGVLELLAESNLEGSA